MSRCHHGHPICQSWMECPECCEEHDIQEAADAAKDALAEQKKQTTLLEQIKKNQEELLKKKSR